MLSGEYIVYARGATFCLSEISANDIKHAMNEVKTTKSVGNDKISCYFSSLSCHIFQMLLRNFSIFQFILADFQKHGKLRGLTLIFKNGDKSEKSYYRPTSILPVLTRLLEEIVSTQLYKYLNEKNLLSLEQSGFRSLHITLSYLIKITDDWYSAFDYNEMVCAVTSDVKLAFDRTIQFFVESWKATGSVINYYIVLNLISRTEGNSSELIGQTPI